MVSSGGYLGALDGEEWVPLAHVSFCKKEKKCPCHYFCHFHADFKMVPCLIWEISYVNLSTFSRQAPCRTSNLRKAHVAVSNLLVHYFSRRRRRYFRVNVVYISERPSSGNRFGSHLVHTRQISQTPHPHFMVIVVMKTDLLRWYSSDSTGEQSAGFWRRKMSSQHFSEIWVETETPSQQVKIWKGKKEEKD